MANGSPTAAVGSAFLFYLALADWILGLTFRLYFGSRLVQKRRAPRRRLLVHQLRREWRQLSQTRGALLFRHLKHIHDVIHNWLPPRPRDQSCSLLSSLLLFFTPDRCEQVLLVAWPPRRRKTAQTDILHYFDSLLFFIMAGPEVRWALGNATERG